MADTKPSAQRWYPTPEESGSHAQHNVHRQILDLTYQTQDRLDKLDAQQKGGSPAQAPPASPPPAATIAGINVKATTPPNNSDTLRYNSKSGQFEFGP